MWDFFSTVRHRHSVRQYLDSSVEKEKIHAIIEMACAAPSAVDLQSYQIFVITDQQKRDSLRDLSYDQDFISLAPVSIVFCADTKRAEQKYGERGSELYAIQDATIAAAYSQLAIVAAGLASTWVGFFDDQKLSEFLSLGDGVKPIAIICAGYAAEIPEATSRRKLDEVVVFDNP